MTVAVGVSACVRVGVLLGAGLGVAIAVGVLLGSVTIVTEPAYSIFCTRAVSSLICVDRAATCTKSAANRKSVMATKRRNRFMDGLLNHLLPGGF